MTKRPFIKALLIDISGNLHIGSTPTPNAIEAIRRLREAKIPFRLCSNASKESTEVLVSKLNAMGFQFATGSNQSGGKEVWTSIGSVAKYVKDHGFKRYVVAGDLSGEDIVLSIQILFPSLPRVTRRDAMHGYSIFCQGLVHASFTCGAAPWSQ